jgi:hypothetical protein
VAPAPDSNDHRSDKEGFVRNRGIWLAALAVLLVGLPLAAAPVISRGVDTFTTTANGSTFYDFAQTPIPAGFFCSKSAQFSGRVVLRGVPLATDVPGALHQADTVIERLDDATFDGSGVATTRIQFKALSLASVTPLKTGCGAFNVYVSLAGKQRPTVMRIYQTEDGGGHFVAPLAVDAKMTFVPVRAREAARNLELVGSFTFPATSIPWAREGGLESKRLASARVDTNGDLTPDTLIFGSSGFAPGWTPGLQTKLVPDYGSNCIECEPRTCHTDPSTGKEHCTGPIMACSDGGYISNCP